MRCVWLLGPLMLAACVAPSAPPPPRPVAPPPPAAAPAPEAAAVDWPDRPVAPGSWRYLGGQSATTASYGQAGQTPLFTLRCDTSAKRIEATRPDGTSASLTLRATTGARSYSARTGAHGATATIDARDAQLDALAFSRGRILIGLPGAADLILPVAPELARVVEDCR